MSKGYMYLTKGKKMEPEKKEVKMTKAAEQTQVKKRNLRFQFLPEMIQKRTV